ncbi:MAG: ABC transporter substrate-binding protein [Actinomycetota bacterium]|nr:ABC transporter substrate-binding protein [Actinomycetota bacterium]
MSEDGESPVEPAAIPEPSGTLRIAVADPIETLDPLLAASKAERLASRQIHEPLLSRQAGPFGQSRQRPGLARAFQASVGDTIWTATLRGGVRFHDGEPLDADAVLANVDRWLSVRAGRELVPELIAADSPQPGQVRFLLDGASTRFPQRLASARLGLIAPNAIPAVDNGLLLPSASRTGTGPFELREREGDRTLLARNADWWGTPLGLGPGVDQLELVDLRDGRLRVDGLVGGSFEVADDLDPDLARAVERNPLLTVVRGGGSVLGMERSVRGIESAASDQPLADVWLTDIR